MKKPDHLNTEKSASAQPQPLCDGLPIEQPPGEDFFCAFIRITDNSDPCWDSGMDFVGRWQTVSQLVSRFLAFDPRARHSTVYVFQGDEARRRFLFGRLEEARYQEQRRAQPNN